MAVDMSEIARLSREEKLALMEALWADLSQSDADLPSPEWHAEELKRTAARLAAGEEALVDWEDAKRDLGKPFD